MLSPLYNMRKNTTLYGIVHLVLYTNPSFNTPSIVTNLELAHFDYWDRASSEHARLFRISTIQLYV